jgi:hypothetical protein
MKSLPSDTFLTGTRLRPTALEYMSGLHLETRPQNEQALFLGSKPRQLRLFTEEAHCQA